MDRSPRTASWLVGTLMITLAAAGALAAGDRAEVNLYGHAQLDAGYDFGRGDPANPDRLRVSRLPSYENEYGLEGLTYFSVRQSRFGVKSRVPAGDREVFVQLEFDFMGSGTTPRLRHFYGEYGNFGAGQYWSPFTDVDAYPPIFESFGPSGIPWVRNAQIRWMPLRGDSRLTFAIEKPGASGEGGDYDELVALQDVQIRLRTPVLSASFRHGGSWGHAQLGGLLRRIWWDDLTDDDVDLAGDTMGWGLTASAVLEFGQGGAVRAQYVIGEGIENYINDSTVDVAPRTNPDDPSRPIEGEALPVQTFTAYVEYFWSEQWGAVGGFSRIDIDNVEGQSADAFAAGNFATATLRYQPASGVTVGLEYQYGKRENYNDGFSSDDFRIQFSAKYSFSSRIGG